MSDLPVAHRITAERLLLLGWSRAILLQFAHPLIAAGVHDHSDFRASPLAAVSRLRHTVGAMLMISFGNEAERRRSIDTIRAIHTRVHGTLPHDVGPFPAGTRYSAEDPALLLWVHATLIESMLMTYERFVAPLDEQALDAYCSEAVWATAALGAREQEIPHTWRELRRYLDATVASGAIVVGPQARELATALMWPSLATILPGSGSLNRLFTVWMLPASIRQQYGMSLSPRQERRAEQVSRAVRSMRRFVPDALAWWPVARRSTFRSTARPLHERERVS